MARVILPLLLLLLALAAALAGPVRAAADDDILMAAVIRIVDDATGGWGHINVDHIVQSDRKQAGVLANAKREFAVTKRYLELPIKNGAKKRVVTLLVDGKAVVRNDVELAEDGKAD